MDNAFSMSSSRLHAVAASQSSSGARRPRKEKGEAKRVERGDRKRKSGPAGASLLSRLGIFGMGKVEPVI